jgi:hypothetical protein
LQWQPTFCLCCTPSECISQLRVISYLLFLLSVASKKGTMVQGMNFTLSCFWYVRFSDILWKKYSWPNIHHACTNGEKTYSSYSFLTSALDGGEWSVSCHSCALLRGEGPPVPIGLEAGWASELVCVKFSLCVKIIYAWIKEDCFIQHEWVLQAIAWNHRIYIHHQYEKVLLSM